MPSSKPHVRATEIGEYIRHHSCERRFRLAFNNRELADSVPFFYQLSSTMDPVLQEAGRQREQEWEASIRGAGRADLCRYDLRPNDDCTAWNDFAAAVPFGRRLHHQPVGRDFGEDVESVAQGFADGFQTIEHPYGGYQSYCCLGRVARQPRQRRPPAPAPANPGPLANDLQRLVPVGSTVVDVMKLSLPPHVLTIFLRRRSKGYREAPVSPLFSVATSHTGALFQPCGWG
jgi:hypothetical protein